MGIENEPIRSFKELGSVDAVAGKSALRETFNLKRAEQLTLLQQKLTTVVENARKSGVAIPHGNDLTLLKLNDRLINMMAMVADSFEQDASKKPGFAQFLRDLETIDFLRIQTELQRTVDDLEKYRKQIEEIGSASTPQ